MSEPWPASLAAHMKYRKLIIFAVSAIALTILACVALTTYWQRSQPVFGSAPKLLEGMRAFARDRRVRGQPLPAYVSLRDLIGGGYVAPANVRAFDGMEVSISLTAREDHPSHIMILARLPDGSATALLEDGSVEQFSAARLQQLPASDRP